MNKHVTQTIFRHFLIRNGCYKRFNKCIYNDIIVHGDDSLSIKNGYIHSHLFVNKITLPELFKEYTKNVIKHNARNAVAVAFPWNCTIEGSGYWCDLHLKWEKFIENHNRNIKYIGAI